jgi:hypothetical protein
MKTSELTGAALDWAVAKCEGTLGHYVQPNEKRGTSKWEITPSTRRYSTNWSQGGPIIEREKINLSVDYQDDALSLDMIPIGWKANLWNNSVPGTPGFLQWAYGPTPLIAAMRCYVASKLGDNTDLPKELL